MLEAWVLVAELDERSAEEERERAQMAVFRELEQAIAEDHRRRDEQRISL
jgi:hypothetical protein